MTLYQNFKKSGQRVIVDLKILSSDLPGTFWNISKEPGFSQIWDLHWNRTSNINLIIDQI